MGQKSLLYVSNTPKIETGAPMGVINEAGRELFFDPEFATSFADHSYITPKLLGACPRIENLLGNCSMRYSTSHIHVVVRKSHFGPFSAHFR